MITRKTPTKTSNVTIFAINPIETQQRFPSLQNSPVEFDHYGKNFPWYTDFQIEKYVDPTLGKLDLEIFMQFSKN